MDMLVVSKDCEFFRIKETEYSYKYWQNSRKHGSAFQQILRDKFTFQHYNNLKHKAKSTLQLLTKTTLNVPEWPSYNFDINRLENLWQDLKMTV